MRATHFLRRFARICHDSWVIHQSGLFAANHYRGQYAKPSFFCRYFPLLHYVFFGAFHGKNPNPVFDTAFYLAENTDVQRANVNPFAHYLRLGAYENRPCTAWLESVLDTERNLLYFRNIIPALNPVLFYLPTRHNQGKTTWGKAGGLYGLLPIRLKKNKRLLQPLKPRARNRQTMAIVERYGQNMVHQPPPFMLLTPFIKQHWPEPQVRQTLPATALPATYAVISALGEDDPIYFDACVKSLEKMMAAAPNVTIEWIIASPQQHTKNLQSRLPLSMKHWVRFYPAARKNKAELINEAAALSSAQWLLVLDEKDQLAPETIHALEEAMRDFPHGRLMLAAMTDIDEKGHILRHRPPLFAPNNFFEEGMPYKLLAIRRDLWQELQGFDARFSACHDYDLTLKAILQEPALCLPKPLYWYRMDALQTLAENNAIDAIRQSFIQYFATRQLGYNPPLPKPPFAANPPRGICFVRTQGKRFDYLLDALLSIHRQTQPLTPCVIVHGNDEVFLQVQDFLQEHHIKAILLHAPDLKRRRGYPLNVGIDYLRAHQDDYDYLCFLDDDDIFYPTFAKTLSQALQDSGKDVVFAQTMGKAKDGSLAPIHPPLPPICLAAGNFIPINAYVVRADFFLAANIRFPEDMDYLEDWAILLQMLAKGATFIPVFEMLAEIRLIGDGNDATFKHNPEHFESCYNRVRNKGQTVANEISIGRLLWDIAAFDWKKRQYYPLHDYERGFLENVCRFFKSKA